MRGFLWKAFIYRCLFCNRMKYNLMLIMLGYLPLSCSKPDQLIVIENATTISYVSSRNSIADIYKGSSEVGILLKEIFIYISTNGTPSLASFRDSREGDKFKFIFNDEYVETWICDVIGTGYVYGIGTSKYTIDSIYQDSILNLLSIHLNIKYNIYE